MSNKADQAKLKILTAAMAILEREGARAVTLDKVALEAEVSKGGLMHHFRTKLDLFTGLLDLTMASMSVHMEAALAKEPVGVPGRYTRSYMQVNLDTIRSGEAESIRRLIELAVAEPGVLDHCRAEMKRLHSQLATDGLDPVHAASLAAASDGCWTNVMLGLWEADEPQIAAVHEYLFASSRQTVGQIGRVSQ